MRKLLRIKSDGKGRSHYLIILSNLNKEEMKVIMIHILEMNAVNTKVN